MKHSALLLVSSCLASCVAAPNDATAFDLESPASFPSHEFSAEARPEPRGEVLAQTGPAPTSPNPPTRPRWNPGQPLMQGFFGVTQFDNIEREGGGTPSVDGDDGDLDEIPFLGGGAQYKLGGERLDYGFEGLFSFGGRANAEAFVIGGGGAAVAVDVDLLIFDLYGGPFVSTFLGDRLRLYAAAGPLLQWADYEESTGLGDDDGSGFGYGIYARTGCELALPSGTMFGLGARWSDSTVDLGGDLGDLEMDGFQLMLTVSRGI